jgi:hypothetical protein
MLFINRYTTFPSVFSPWSVAWTAFGYQKVSNHHVKLLQKAHLLQGGGR